MDNELLLLSNNDIPFVEAQINIHQPRIKEIALIGEESFFAGCQFLNFNKFQLSEKDRVGLEDKSDFNILMSIMCGKEKMHYKYDAMMVLSLLFPQHKIQFKNNEIFLLSEANMSRINEQNYDIFKDILVNMFVLSDNEHMIGQYNPADKRAAKIAKRLQNRKKKSGNNEKKKVAIFSRYISVLAVGEKKDINSLMDYTVYQLKDEFERFQKKQNFDFNMKARLAGATYLEDVDNWMEDIHP